MPTTKELAFRLEDRPGTIGKVSRALADRGVNIPTTAKTVLDAERVTYTEVEVALVKLPHRPGELARAASRLGEANININYAYCGVEPGANAPLLIFGVAEVGQAVAILDQTATAAAGT